MPLLNDIHSIIVAAGSANFSAHSYTEVFASTLQTPTINGVSVKLAAGQSVKIKVSSISSTSDVYLLGETIDNRSDNPILGG
jgi:hypothetical protein